jgi:Cys-tRNA(Pro) deacylase
MQARGTPAGHREAIAVSGPRHRYDGVVSRIPVTPATRLLNAQGVAYTPRLYRYEDHGGTRVSARALGVDEHAVVKTLVMQDETNRPLVVLMHGDLEVSTKALARQIGCKAIAICAPDVATRHSGYLVGGTSPFGTRKPMPVYMERTILDLPLIHINGGHRGFLVSLDPREIVRLLDPTLVEVGHRT